MFDHFEEMSADLMKRQWDKVTVAVQRPVFHYEEGLTAFIPQNIIAVLKDILLLAPGHAHSRAPGHHRYLYRPFGPFA